ncbi:hypothetical protein [Peribacillus simplex]|uniref:Uncharacterized protein n=1 Tax=Peribacillus simplex TaxID=1478 RepID=A0A9W4KX11_9BACI|nr:hypothetical protein [Peribacillus simplex]MDR4927253.1 hypothetical protein [Peribacillus simplex]WHX92503.1 hypothetical protein QNH50_06480 [Peribacillus simplex]CAH0190602.1 hypothetical protein SRABI133_01654 [Peribacillus simplex]
MKKYYIAAFSVLLLLGVFYWFYSSSSPKELSTSDMVAIEQESEVTNAADYGSIGYGLENLKGKVIDEGSTLNSTDNEVSVVASVDNDIDEDRKYALLVFEDYKQVKFKVKNKEQDVNKYFFDMKPNSSINFNVSVPIRSDSSELTFVIVQKPEYKLKELDLNRAGILEQVLSMRYSINKADNGIDVKKIKEVKPDAIVKDGLNENISITNSQEKLQSIMTEKEDKKLKFSAGNETNAEIGYAIIALKDWEQVAVLDNTEVLYTTVPPETRHLFDFKLPEVESEENFQLIAFPFPYEVSPDNYESQQTFGSFRVVIQDKE